MTIPFLSFFRKKEAAPQATVEAPPPVPVDKPSSDRLSKTVMPNSTRVVTTQEASEPSYATTATAYDPVAPPPRTVSFAGSASSSRSSDLPPAVALALEPKVERVISLELSEVVRQMPIGWIRPVSETEGERRILLKAAELERGMASGQPAVSLTSIYRQIPEIFVRPVPEGDGHQVGVPFDKVLEQFSKVQPRTDQVRDSAVPQVETPFLKVTLEDNSRFGISSGPIEIEVAEMPPILLQPATAEAIAAAEPEPVTRETTKSQPGSVPFSLPVNPSLATPAPVPAKPVEAPVPAPAAAPMRIPFKLSPTGPDVPASERVPASSGPSVPTSSPAPTRIPFKLSTATEEEPANSEMWLTKDNLNLSDPALSVALAPAAPAPTPALPEVKIALPLTPILNALPPFQLTGDIRKVPDDARIEIPFRLIEPQLSTGRIAMVPDDFAAALPEEYKSLFSSKEIAAPVALPLQEVLKNLPAATLRMRDDQVLPEKAADFETPFSAAAHEDAKRFKVAPVANVAESPVATEAPPPAVAPEVEPAPEPQSAPAQPLPEPAPSAKAGEAAVPETVAETTEPEPDAKATMARLEKLAGVKACAIMFGDGLSLVGSLPPEYGTEGLCAMAPTLLQRTENHLGETKLGALRSLTLSCEKAAISFFMHDNLCLAALHQRELSGTVRTGLSKAVQELSRKYSHPL